jgi:exopolysaccharide biosynthesis polyprenyl glycosylphosphotransferase
VIVDSAEKIFQVEPSALPALGGLRRQFGVRLTPPERRFLLAGCDLLLVNGALVGALVAWGDFPPRLAALTANFKWFLTLSVVWLILAAALDVYDLVRAASTTQSILYAGLAAGLAGLFYLAIPWLTPPLGSRLQAFGFVGLAVVGIVGWRAVYAQLLFQPLFQRRVLVVGRGAASRALARELHAAASAPRANPFRGSGCRVVGYVEDELGPPRGPPLSTPILKPTDNLVHLARCLGADEIIVADEGHLSPLLREAIMDCREVGLAVTPLSLAYERLTARLPIEYAAQDVSIIVGAADSPSARLYWAGKRLMDVVISLIGVSLVGLLSSPIALANALSSPGPLFYRQHRVGRGGRPFVLIKFRTMIPGAEAVVGAQWAASDDGRATPIGRWLRRTRLDELPQFINVLRGEMSVVGPRPERAQFVGQLMHHLPLYRARHAVPPGITGWAQLRYHYGNTIEDARIKLEYDLYYVKYAGFFLDLLIILQTIPSMLQLKGC